LDAFGYDKVELNKIYLMNRFLTVMFVQNHLFLSLNKLALYEINILLLIQFFFFVILKTFSLKLFAPFSDIT